METRQRRPRRIRYLFVGKRTMAGGGFIFQPMLEAIRAILADSRQRTPIPFYANWDKEE